MRDEFCGCRVAGHTLVLYNKDSHKMKDKEIRLGLITKQENFPQKSALKGLLSIKIGISLYTLGRSDGIKINGC